VLAALFPATQSIPSSVLLARQGHALSVLRWTPLDMLTMKQLTWEKRSEAEFWGLSPWEHWRMKRKASCPRPAQPQDGFWLCSKHTDPVVPQFPLLPFVFSI